MVRGEMMATKPETTINLTEEAAALVACLRNGDAAASVHLARLIEADAHGALLPFAEALGARIIDHLNRFAELNITEPDATLDEEVYQLLKVAAIDWALIPEQGRAGEGRITPDFV